MRKETIGPRIKAFRKGRGITQAEYNAMLETICLVSQEGLVEKIKEGEKEDISKMFTYNPNEEW